MLEGHSFDLCKEKKTLLAQLAKEKTSLQDGSKALVEENQALLWDNEGITRNDNNFAHANEELFQDNEKLVKKDSALDRENERLVDEKWLSW